MPTYLFLDESTNTVHEVVDTMTSPAAETHFGEYLEIDGKQMRRLPTYPGIDVEKDWAHIAYTLDPADPDVPRVVEHNGTRQVLMLNKREIFDYEAKKRDDPNYQHMRLRYDCGSHR